MRSSIRIPIMALLFWYFDRDGSVEYGVLKSSAEQYEVEYQEDHRPLSPAAGFASSS